jgi:hypothetical protein
MYLLSVFLLMLVLPAVSIAIEFAVHMGVPLLHLVGKWFVFWPVGVRLLLAGLRQNFQPAFTAETIFGIADPAARKLVREIGFGNLALGLLGLLTLAVPEWTLPAAIAGGLYYGLAGLLHLASRERSRAEVVALVSDLAIFVVLALWLAGTLAFR